MFSGLSDYLKKILPKRLFYRALLIVAIPVLVLQLVITIVFFDSLWIKTNKGMTRTLVNEISTFIEAYGSEQEKKQELLDLFSIFLDLNIEFANNAKRFVTSFFSFSSLSYALINILISFINVLVIPLFVLIQRLSKKTTVITNCKTITGIATIKSAL